MRIYHGPVTVGGIGWHLAEWQRKQHISSDCLVYEDHGNRQLYHAKLKLSDYSNLRKLFLRFSFFCFCLFRYDLFNFYSGQSFFPFGIDLPILKLFGKKLVMTYCGSDIRLIQINSEWNQYHKMLTVGLNHPKYDLAKRVRMRWQAIWIDKFFAIRELAKYAKTTIHPSKILETPWVNNIGFDSDFCFDKENLSTNEIPILLHAPSNSVIKGARFVESAIAVLKARKLKFEYVELRNTPNSEVWKLIQSCDIVIDQCILGEIGTLAFEGMGFGKPVVSYLPKTIVDERMPGCPVFNASIDNLADRLEELIVSPRLRIDLGRKGIQFVRNNLDYQCIQAEVLQIYREL